MSSAQEKIENIFTEIGEIGPYQILITIICGSAGIITAMITYSTVFIAALPKYR